jgi:hypothetical protein
MPHKNPLVKSVRPVETWEDDYLQQDNSYKIAIKADGTGQFVASANVNGHQFSESASERNRAAYKLQKTVDKAIEDGKTVHDKE